MSGMKNWLEDTAELFCEYHPNFSEEWAISYMLTHETQEYWEGLKNRIVETIEKCHRYIHIKECDTSRAVGLALAMGQSYAYNPDYLASRILIKCENNSVLIWVANDVDDLMMMPIPGYKKHRPLPLVYGTKSKTNVIDDGLYLPKTMNAEEMLSINCDACADISEEE